MNTTGSIKHDISIVQRKLTQKTVPDKKRKVKSGYVKHKQKYI
jgi:hypothetical protein